MRKRCRLKCSSPPGARPIQKRKSDEELKTLALQGLMNNDPHRGIEMIQKRLAGSASPKEKAKMLFVLAQNGSTESKQLLEKLHWDRVIRNCSGRPCNIWAFSAE